jgi:hypothetical protein
MTFLDMPLDGEERTAFTPADLQLIRGTLVQNLNNLLPGWPYENSRGPMRRMWESDNIGDIARLAAIGATLVDIGGHQHDRQLESGLAIVSDKFKKVFLTEDELQFAELHIELEVARNMVKHFPEKVVLEPYDRPYRQGPPKPSPDLQVSMAGQPVAVEITAAHWEPFMIYTRQAAEMTNYFGRALHKAEFSGEFHIAMDVGRTDAQKMRNKAMVHRIVGEHSGDIDEGGVRLRWARPQVVETGDGWFTTVGSGWMMRSTSPGMVKQGLTTSTTPRFLDDFEAFEKWFADVKVKGKRRQLRQDIPTMLILSDPSVLLTMPDQPKPEIRFEYLANRIIFDDRYFDWLSALALHIQQGSYMRGFDAGRLVVYFNPNARRPIPPEAQAFFPPDP